MADEDMVERLAKAWLAEAKRLRSSAICACGCEKPIKTKTRFVSGHDGKLLSVYRQRVRAILTTAS